MVNNKLCGVCGYEMEEGPRNYNICPSCGTEFGLHDVNSTIEDLRQVWLGSGPRWYSAVVPKPAGWNPMMQLARLLFGNARMTALSTYYSLGIATTQGAIAGSDTTACKPLESQYT